MFIAASFLAVILRSVYRDEGSPSCPDPKRKAIRNEAQMIILNFGHNSASGAIEFLQI